MVRALGVGELPGTGHPVVLTSSAPSTGGPTTTWTPWAGRNGTAPAETATRGAAQRPTTSKGPDSSGAAGREEAVLLVQPLRQREERGHHVSVTQQIERHVVERLEQTAARRLGGAATGRADPALAEADALDGELLGQVVELVPGVVGLVGGGVGDLGEREEAEHPMRVPAARNARLGAR